MSRFDVTTLGEAMLRLSVPAGRHLETMTGLDVHLGGAESNVCAALASLGRRCAWFSRVPEGPLGRYALRTLRAAGIDTSGVVISEEGRLGTYYVEFAAAPRATEVVYDRSGAAITGLTAEMLEWPLLLDTQVLHLTGITPALSEGCFELVLEAAKRAQAAGITVTFDVNYRRKLWTPEQAAGCLQAIFPYIDVLVCGQSDAQTLFGLSGDASEILTGLGQLTPAQHVVLTQSDAGAATFLEGELVQVKAKKVDVVDRLGAGDAFAAGLLDGFLKRDLRLGLAQGVALSALVLAQHGDMLVTTPEELAAMLGEGLASLNR